MAIMEVLLPVIFLNVCGMLLKAKFGLDGAESYLIALMGVLSFLYIGGIFNLLLPAAAGIFIGILLLLLAAVKKSRSQKRSLAAVCGLKEYFNPFVLLNNLSCLVFTVPFPVSWTVKMKKKQKETQDILSYHTQAAGCSDKARAKASGGRQPIEECGRTGL